MTAAMIALVILLALAVLGVYGLPQGQRASPLTAAEVAEEARDYEYVRDVMPQREFHAIRMKNRAEQEQFGDGRHAPSWPKPSLNGAGTLRRGVWVDDFASPVPTDSELDKFREDYQRTHRIVRFTLVEGEQLAPLGQNGALIRVRATSGTPGEIRSESGDLQQYVPMVSIAPLDTKDGWWGTSMMGSLPMEMSVSVEDGASRP